MRFVAKSKRYISLNELKKCPEMEKYENIEELGKGTNGKTFKAKHKFLKQNVVIKVYAIFKNETKLYKDKHKKEILKNSAFRLSKNQSVIFDAGELKGCNDDVFYYCVMNYLNGITLEEWIKCRDEYKRRDNHESYKDDNLLSKIEFNAVLGFLFHCHDLIENDLKLNLTHGDLNPGNIIMLIQNYSADSEDFLNFTNIYGDYLVPMDVEFIDYGTSEWKNTNKSIGVKRDIKYIFNNTKSILSRYPIKKFFDYDKFINLDSKLDVEYRMKCIIVDLIRIVLSLYFLELNLPFMDANGKHTKSFCDWVFKLWYGEFKWEESFEFNYFINLNYWKVLKRPSCGSFIKENEIVDYVNSLNLSKLKLYFDENLNQVELR